MGRSMPVRSLAHKIEAVKALGFAQPPLVDNIDPQMSRLVFRIRLTLCSYCDPNALCLPCSGGFNSVRRTFP